VTKPKKDVGNKNDTRNFQSTYASIPQEVLKNVSKTIKKTACYYLDPRHQDELPELAARTIRNGRELEEELPTLFDKMNESMDQIVALYHEKISKIDEELAEIREKREQLSFNSTGDTNATDSDDDSSENVNPNNLNDEISASSKQVMKK